MSREPQDREDLLRDATAYHARVQLMVRCCQQDTIVFAGFRANQAASFYFDQDPVYHFNHAGQLRRAFVEDRLFKAEAGRLVRWHRHRDEYQVKMVRDELSPDQQRCFLSVVTKQLVALNNCLVRGQYEIEGQVSPIDMSPALDLLTTFVSQVREIEVANSPGVHG